MFARATAPKSARDCGNLHMFHVGPTSSKCIVLIRHGRNISSTWGQLRPTRLQLRPNLAPKWGKLDPFGNNFGPSWGPHGFKMGDMAGPIRNPKNARFDRYFPLFLGVDDASCWAMFPMCCVGPNPGQFCGLSWAQVGPKLEPTDPSSAQVRKDGQVWPQSALVGPRTPAPFLSIQFSGCGRFSSRSDSNKIASAKADHVATLRFGSFWAAKSVNPWSVAVCESVISGQKLKQRWHYRVLSCKWHPELAVPRISWQQGRCMYHAAGVRVAHEAPDLPVVKKPTEQSQQLLPWNANHQNFTCR